jgi:hypothetical protein
VGACVAAGWQAARTNMAISARLINWNNFFDISFLQKE